MVKPTLSPDSQVPGLKRDRSIRTLTVIPVSELVDCSHRRERVTEHRIARPGSYILRSAALAVASIYIQAELDNDKYLRTMESTLEFSTGNRNDMFCVFAANTLDRLVYKTQIYLWIP